MKSAGKTFILGLPLALGLLLAPALPVLSQSVPERPPETRTDNVKETLHGVELVDPYRWLEDQESRETRAWLEAQNEYARSILDSMPGREGLKERFAELMKIDEIDVPTVRGDFYFYSKREADKPLRLICVRRGLRGRERVLVDPHTMSPDLSLSVKLMNVSSDGSLVAYGIRRGGEDEVSVRFLDVPSGQELPDLLPRSRYFGIAIGQRGWKRHPAG